MLTEQQRQALARIENQLGAEDPGLAHALDTMAPPMVVSRSRRTGRWMFLAALLVAPVLTIALLALIPASWSPILLGGLMVATVSVLTATAVRRQHTHR
ncbi:MAG TPA: DUF3040 domain-containing protein [Pseudonocardia sp.]|nr:DUF3040 domain-containing protein [Pseudonocardia sp.]